MDNFNDYKYQTQRFLDNIEKLPPQDKAFVYKAYVLAEKYHHDQLRDDGVPYFIHPLRISSSIIEELNLLKKEVLAATLFHDTVEDTAMTIENIIEEFCEITAQLVENLTRNHAGDSENNKYVRKLKKIQAIMQKDYNTRVIKTLDILDNMQSWCYIPKEHPSRKKFPRWFEEVETMNIPLAETVDNRLVDKMREALERAKKLV